VRSQGPVDKRPAAFSERVVVLVEDGSPHHASTQS
jgi:hypothetical protein